MVHFPFDCITDKFMAPVKLQLGRRVETVPGTVYVYLRESLLPRFKVKSAINYSDMLR